MRKTVPMFEVFYKKMRRQVTAALEARKESAYIRAHHGAEDPAIVLCLGPGRCMAPSQSGDKFCPFCKRYPEGRRSDDDAETVIACMRSGH